MNILICDDIKNETNKFKILLNDLGIEPVIFNNGDEVLDYIHTGALVDICFLDIIMPEMSGVALAEELRDKGYNGAIVFLTTSNEYATESYKVKAYSYLLKPPELNDVRSILHQLEYEKKKKDSEGILIKVSKVARYVLFHDISHIEVIKHYVYFRLINGEEIEIYATFTDIASKLLNDQRFARCHRSYIVNMIDIAMIDKKEIIMKNGKKIPYTKSYSDIKKKFTKFIIFKD